MSKRISGHMWTARARLSLHVRAVWSGLLLSTISIIRHFRMYVSIEPKSPDATAHAWGEPEAVLFSAYFKRPFRLARPKCRCFDVGTTLSWRHTQHRDNVVPTSHDVAATLVLRCFVVACNVIACNIKTMSYQRRCNVKALHRRWCNVV